MGLLLFPVLLLIAAVWILNMVFLFIRISKGNMRLWSLAIAPFFSVLVFALYWQTWKDVHSVWVLEPMITVPGACVALPSAIGLMGVFIEKRMKLLNIIGFAMSISSAVSGPLVILLQMTDPRHFFPAIEYTY